MSSSASSSGNSRKRSVKGSKGTSDRSSSPVQSIPQGEEKKRKKKGVSWRPVCKTIGYFGLAFLIPTLLNYAVINQESRMLVPEGIAIIGTIEKLVFQNTLIM